MSKKDDLDKMIDSVVGECDADRADERARTIREFETWLRHKEDCPMNPLRTVTLIGKGPECDCGLAKAKGATP